MADKLWYAALKGQQAGPFGEAQFREMIARGEVTRDTLVWAAPMPGWSKAGEVAELFTAAPRPPGLPPSVPYSGQPASAPASYAALPASAPGTIRAASRAPRSSSPAAPGRCSAARCWSSSANIW